MATRSSDDSFLFLSFSNRMDNSSFAEVSKTGRNQILWRISRILHYPCFV